ncbi:MAG: SDR family NAD(P)-dependent oxidoreductase [Anaerolineae bacterium]|nr:SDR family NAD(P)-dependent oxidoreductase [Anaerolineae bacterium]
MIRQLQGQVAIITGASSGIGRATALALAREGCRVALAARRQSLLEDLAHKIRELGQEALVIPTDVTKREEVQKLISQTLASWGQVDILVANAGAYIRKPIAQLTVADLERPMAVNFYGAVHAILETLPHMLRRHHGHIVLVTSFDARKGLPLDAPYVAAKCALSGLGDVMRQELHGTGVDVTIVFPGRVDTPLIDTLEVPRISAKIPPEKVAQSIVRAIRRGKAEVIVPAFIRSLDWLRILCPRLSDWVVRLFHLEGWEAK